MARTKCSCGGPIVSGEGWEVCVVCGETRRIEVQAIDCGGGPWVILDSVICPTCGPRRFTTLDDDPRQVRLNFPLGVRADFVRENGPCSCGETVLSAVLPMPVNAQFSWRDDIMAPDAVPLLDVILPSAGSATCYAAPSATTACEGWTSSDGA